MLEIELKSKLKKTFSLSQQKKHTKQITYVNKKRGEEDDEENEYQKWYLAGDEIFWLNILPISVRHNHTTIK